MKVKPFVTTYIGLRVDLLNTLPEQIQPTDIVMGLSRARRWAGQSHVEYSVAQHSVEVYRLLKRWSPDRLDLQMAGLMHDASEAYLGDVPTPWKALMPDYLAVERRLMNMVAVRFNFSPALLDSLELQNADTVLKLVESRDLFKPSRLCDLFPGEEEVSVSYPELQPVGTGRAAQLFTEAYLELKEAM